MNINIKTSEANKDRVVALTARLGNNIKENVVARIALAYSLAKGSYPLRRTKNRSTTAIVGARNTKTTYYWGSIAICTLR